MSKNMNREDIIKMMDWHQDEDVQLYAINEAMKDESIDYWIQPGYYKYSWENCAKVVVSKDDLILSKYLSKILKWLQDINWPGALIILERLEKFNPLLLKEELEATIIEANEQNDLEWLECLSGFWDVKEIRDILENPARAILKESYNKLN